MFAKGRFTNLKPFLGQGVNKIKRFYSVYSMLIRFIFIALAIVSVMIVAMALIMKIFSSSKYVQPSSICIDGVIYCGTASTIEILTQEEDFLGKIVSSVSSDKTPAENFQTNEKDIVSSPVYRVEDGIAIYYKGQWWPYYRRNG